MNIIHLSLNDKIKLCAEQVEIIMDKYFDITVKINGNFPGNDNREKIVPQLMYDVAYNSLYGQPARDTINFTNIVRTAIISEFMLSTNKELIKAIDVYLENLEKK